MNPLGKETSGSHDTFYQNAIHYKERINAFIKNHKDGIFSFAFVIKPERCIGLQETDKSLKAYLNF